MNILNILYNFYSGGVERLAIDVSNQMAEMGQNAHICIISGKYSKELLNQVTDDVHVHILKKGKHRKIDYVIQILRIIDVNHIEVVHVHQGTLMSFFLIIKTLRPKVRIYFTSHDTHIFSELSRKDQKIAASICNGIIAISDAVSEDIVRQGVKKSKITRIYNGVDFSRFPLKIRKKDLSKGAVIANVARFAPKKKGQDILIRAAAILCNRGYKIIVRFAGGETAASIGEMQCMKELTVELGISSQVDFLGNVNNVSEFLEEVDIFCIPSRYEGFGISAVEAMATGLPCIASDIIGLNEVVNDPALGRLFKTENERDLADKIEYILLNKEEFNAEKISENVRSRFSIKHMCEELLAVYEK